METTAICEVRQAPQRHRGGYSPSCTPQHLELKVTAPARNQEENSVALALVRGHQGEQIKSIPSQHTQIDTRKKKDQHRVHLSLAKIILLSWFVAPVNKCAEKNGIPAIMCCLRKKECRRFLHDTCKSRTVDACGSQTRTCQCGSFLFGLETLGGCASKSKHATMRQN